MFHLRGSARRRHPLEKLLRLAVESLLINDLSDHVVYTLSDENMQGRAVRSMLRSVAGRNGNLEVEIG